MRPRSAALVVSALALAAVTPACGDDDGPDHLAAGDDFSVEAALAELPVPPDLDDGQPIGVNVLDLDAASEAAGVDRPAADADRDDVEEWWAVLSRPTDDGDVPPIPVPPFDVFGLGRVPTGTVEDELGLSVGAVRAIAQVAAPPFVFGLAQGELDEDDLAGADLDERDGVFTAGSGEDLEPDPEGRTDIRGTGAPLRLAARGDRIAASSTTAELEAWRDGEGRSLAEEDDLRAIAAALDEGDAVAAVILTGDFGGRPAGGRQTPEQVEADAELIPIEEVFTAAGIGFALEDDAPTVTVAYAFDSEADAETAADQVEAAYADGVSLLTREPIADRLEVTDVGTEGAVVVARLRVVDGPPGAVISMLSNHDTPFTHR